MSSLHIPDQWRSFLLRIVVPTILTIVLFVMALFTIIIPTIEYNSLERKREMIRELTNAAWNILAKFEYDEQKGLLTRQEAQQPAIAQVKNLHYGERMKDYFWINDMHPRMIIHPYRSDLDNTDLSDYKDPSGKKLFVEMVDVVRRDGAGYVEYQWQWQDDTTRIVPKISYVKGFHALGLDYRNRNLHRRCAPRDRPDHQQHYPDLACYSRGRLRTAGDHYCQYL